MLKTYFKFFAILLLSFILTGCATYKPSNNNNLCDIFMGKISWYKDARSAQKKWGTPISIMMAIMNQESSFVKNARPKRKWFLWIIPRPRKSSAYGYAQAQNPVWGEYKKSRRRSGADRDKFDDAIDFIGWYTDGTQKQLNVSKWDTYAQYLAYHEGRGGYKRKTYNKKPWLKGVANKVKKQAELYGSQLKTCKTKLDKKARPWWLF